MKASEVVGAAFAALVLAREGWIAHMKRERRITACKHHWREPFKAMGSWHRSCCCCDLQQHSDDGENWGK